MKTRNNDFDPQDSPDFDEAIELLVLNELSVTDQRGLIERIDRTEGGWKRCAIAFIENQRMGNALCAFVAGRDTAMEYVSADLQDRSNSRPPCSPAVVGRSKASASATKRRAHLLWAVAATTALIGGFLFGRFNGGNVQPGESGSNKMALAVGTRSLNKVLNDEALRQIAKAQSAVGEKDFQVVAMLQARTGSENRYFPIVTSSRLERKLDALPQPGLSPGTSAQLKREGWQVDKHRQLLSMQMPDGQYTLTPLDLFKCRYVGKALY